MRSSTASRGPDHPLRHARHGGAQQAGIVVQPLDIAAEPVQIVGDAALQLRPAAIDRELVEAPAGRQLHVGASSVRIQTSFNVPFSRPRPASAVSPTGSRARPPGNTR